MVQLSHSQSRSRSRSQAIFSEMILISILSIFGLLHSNLIVNADTGTGTCSNSIFTVMDAEVCYTTGQCSIDPVTGQWAPINVVGKIYASTADSDWINVDKPAHLEWTKNNSVGVMYHRLDPERMRYGLPQLCYSSGYDILRWQSKETIESCVADLTANAIANNWASRYSENVLSKTTTSDGKIIAIVETFKFWGIWYNKALFQKLNISIIEPVTWSQFIEMCERILNYGLVPIGLGSADNWQGMTWWEMIAFRLGGADWYNRMSLAGPYSDGTGVNFATDPIHLQSWAYVDSLKKYFPQPLNLTANMALLDVYIKWVTQEWAMVLSTSTTAVVPSQISPSFINSDYDFFYFPEINANLTWNDTGEFSSFIVLALNQYAQQPEMAMKYLNWLTSDEYVSKFANYTQGAASGLTSQRSSITDPTLIRGFDYLNNGVANIMNMIDTGNLAVMINDAKPIFFEYFTGQITDYHDVVDAMEQLRVEIILQSVSVPSINITGVNLDKIVSIDCPTDNATIYYASTLILNGVPESEDVYILYTGPIGVFDNSNYRIRSYARKTLMKDSDTVEATFTTSIGSSYHDGDEMKHQMTSLSILVYCFFFIASLIFLLSLDHANRNKDHKIFWTVFGSLPFSAINGTLLIISFYLMSWQLNVTFDYRFAIIGVFLHIIIQGFGDYLLIRFNRDIIFSNNNNNRLSSNRNSASLSLGSRSGNNNTNNNNNNSNLITNQNNNPNNQNNQGPPPTNATATEAKYMAREPQQVFVQPQSQPANHNLSINVNSNANTSLDANNNNNNNNAKASLIVTDPLRASRRKRWQLLISISFLWTLGLCVLQTLLWTNAQMNDCIMSIDFKVIFGEFLLLWTLCMVIIYCYMKWTHPAIRIIGFCLLETLRFYINSALHIQAIHFQYYYDDDDNQSLSQFSIGNVISKYQNTPYQYFIVGGAISGVLACFDVVSILLTLKDTVVKSDWAITQQHKQILRLEKELKLMTRKYQDTQLYYSKMLTLAPFCDHNQLTSHPFKNLQYINYSGNNSQGQSQGQGRDQNHSNAQSYGNGRNFGGYHKGLSLNSQHTMTSSTNHITTTTTTLNQKENQNNNSINFSDSPKGASVLSVVGVGNVGGSPSSPPSSKLALLGFDGEEKIDWNMMNMNNLPTLSLDDILADDYACYIFMTYASIKKKEEMCFIMHYRYLQVQLKMNCSPGWEIDRNIQSIFKMFIADDAKMKLNLSQTSKAIIQAKFAKSYTREEYVVALNDLYNMTKNQLITPNFITELNSPVGGDNGKFWLKAAHQFVFAHQKNISTHIPYHSSPSQQLQIQMQMQQEIQQQYSPQKIIVGSISINDHENDNENNNNNNNKDNYNVKTDDIKK